MNYKKNLIKTGAGPQAAAILLSLFLVPILLSCASIQAKTYGGLGKASDPVPFIAAARTGTLPNGLRYYILENARPEGRAYLTLAVNAGSVLEEDDEQGLAHFVEHMAFNGTRRFPESELINYLRSLGMRFGPEVNAYTTYDETVFGIEVPVENAAGVKRIPGKALAVIDDWTYAITFAPKDVDDERLVIMEEYRSSLGAMERFRRKILPLLFQNSPYAERSPIGLPEIIQNAPAERLENFYRTWYRTDNMALILVGDFDGAALEADLARHFSAPAPKTPLKHPVYDLPPPQKGNLQAEIFTDPELTVTRIDMYYKRAPKANRADLASFRQNLIDSLIEQMLSFRFDEATSKPETPYIGAGAGALRLGASSRFYIMMAYAKTGNAEATLRELLREKESLVRYGFTGPELARAKTSLLSDLTQRAAEKDRQNSDYYVQLFTSSFLTGDYAAGIEWELAAAEKLLPLIGAEAISKSIQDYFAADDVAVFISAPEAEAAALPDPERIRQLVLELRSASIAPPVAEAVSGELIAEDPQPGLIAAESENPAAGVIIWELDNGAKIILKETANKNNEVSLYALARGGITSVDDKVNISASLAAEMLEASGTGPYSRPVLVKKLADKQVSVSFWTTDYYRGFQGAAAGGDLKALFELLYLTFTQPRLDADAVQAMLDQYRTTLAQQNEDPDTVFSHEITRTIYGNHPRFKPLETADLDRVSIDEALAFLKDALNPGDYTFVFTGNLDTATLRPLVETYLASIPPGRSWNSWQNPHITRPFNVGKTVFKGKEERSLVFLGWYAPTVYSEQAGAAAAALNEYLDIILTEEIREALGGVYSISANVSISPIPSGEAAMGVYFACDPQRAQELVSAITARIQHAAEGGIDAGVFAKAVEALKKNFESSMESNVYIARSYANLSVLLNLPLDRLDKRPELYEAVTIRDMQGIVRQLLQNPPVQVILYPEGWLKKMTQRIDLQTGPYLRARLSAGEL
ncbi:MAG: insulinase family protein [Treponema sp.]|jgi:zinc protease|nr:insulinase family protein [Treponema sp.]